MKALRQILLISLLGAAAFAQTSPNVSVFATGFSNPRGLKWGPDGNLYVAEAGTGGNNSTTPEECAQVVPPIGPYSGGSNAKISKVTYYGARSVLAKDLPSSRAATGDTEGVEDVAFIGDQLYALLAGGGCSHGHPNFPNSVLKINADGSWSRLANLSQYQMLHPVNNPNAGDFEPDGVWYSMISVDRNLYAVEPNHGEVDEITTEGIVTRLIDVSAAEGHVVPTAIARIKNGFYLANLDLFPIVPGSASRFSISDLGEVKTVFSGLTTVVAIVVDGNDTYFLELSDSPGFPTPGKGDVVRLRGGNLKIIADGLTVPTGMTLGPDGALYVSNFGDGGPAGAGQVVRITLP